MITSGGVKIPKNKISKNIIQKWFKTELVKKVGNIETKKILEFYGEDADYFWLPVYGAKKMMQHHKMPLIDVRENAYEKLEATSNIQLRDYQEEYVATAKYQKQILTLPTATGKTIIALYLAEKIGYKTLIIVPPSKSIRQQWLDTIEEYFTIPSNKNKTHAAEIGVANFAVETPQAALKSGNYLKYHTIIYDEIHAFCSPVFCRLLLTGAPAIIGLTATPNERLDGFDKFLIDNVGKIVPFKSTTVTVKQLKYVATNYVAKPAMQKKMDDVPENPATGATDYGALCKVLQTDKDRLKIIMDLINKLYMEGRTTLIFTNFREYANRIFIRLTPEQQTDAVLFLGGATKSAEHAAYNTAKIIITNFSKCDKGVSIDSADSIILASPKKSGMKQIVGRIFRTLYGDEFDARERILYDIVDEHPMLKRQFYSRKKAIAETCKVKFEFI